MKLWYLCLELPVSLLFIMPEEVWKKERRCIKFYHFEYVFFLFLSLELPVEFIGYFFKISVFMIT